MKFSDQFNSSEIKLILDKGLSRGGEFSEIFFERTQNTSISLSERKVKSITSGISEGIGIRVLHRGRTGYAYSDILTLENLLEAAEIASFIAEGNGKINEAVSGNSRNVNKFDASKSIIAAKLDRKVNLLFRADEEARSHSPLVKEVNAGYGETVRSITIANSEGLQAEHDDEIFRLSISVLAMDEGKRESGIDFLGGRYRFDYFDTHTPESSARKAVEQALTKLKAKPAPSGQFPVVIEAGWGGVLVHEGVGHGLEGDFNRKGISIYSGQIGKQVTSELVTIIDDGTVPHARGTLAIDDEGTLMQKTLLIESGVLVGFLYDRLNASLMNTQSTGSGRRESYQHIPLPRMRNTYIDAGKDRKEDLIRSVSNGVYAKSLGGGQVDIVSGNFVFEINEGYMIEQGRITSPIRGANLIGNGPDAMRKVIGVADNLEIERRVGSCGKDGQYVPVGVGQPTILLSEMTIGGTGS